MEVTALRVLTLNIHKGFSTLNTRFVLHELRDAIRHTQADVVFLQEVQGEHTRKAALHDGWPEQAQYEFLADQVWTDFAYGKNAVYDAGHHGNAILSKFPITRYEKRDISTNPIEQRGILWCELALPEGAALHCVCVHLGLSAVARRKQLGMVADFVTRSIPRDAPFIVAGDFNDWSGAPTRQFSQSLGLQEAYKTMHGRPARTFPVQRPVLSLDKVLCRGLKIHAATTYCEGVWQALSDHAALAVDLAMPARVEAARSSAAAE